MKIKVGLTEGKANVVRRQLKVRRLSETDFTLYMQVVSGVTCWSVTCTQLQQHNVLLMCLYQIFCHCHLKTQQTHQNIQNLSENSLIPPQHRQLHLKTTNNREFNINDPLLSFSMSSQYKINSLHRLF